MNQQLTVCRQNQVVKILTGDVLPTDQVWSHDDQMWSPATRWFIWGPPPPPKVRLFVEPRALSDAWGKGYFEGNGHGGEVGLAAFEAAWAGETQRVAALTDQVVAMHGS